MVNIKIHNKIYKVEEAKTREEKIKGLSNIESLPEDEGMLFYFNEDEQASMWMKDVLIPLDIIYIDEDQEVIYVYEGQPNDKKLVTIQDTAYVLEINANSGIKVGDELEFEEDFEDEGPVMEVLAPDGSSQFSLWGGERIVSRRETKILIKKAKKADLSKSDSDYKALGKYIFKVFNKQDNRNPEYVQLPDSQKQE